MNEPRPLPKSEPEILAGALDWGATLAEHERWLRRVVAARLDTKVGVILQPLNRRLKSYAVGDGWKFLSDK